MREHYVFQAAVFFLLLCSTSRAACDVWVANKTCECTISAGGYACSYRVDSMCSGTDYYNTTVLTSFRWASTDPCGTPAELQTGGFSGSPGVPYSISLAGYDETGQILCARNETLVCTGPAIVPTVYNCSSCDECSAMIENASFGDIVKPLSDILGPLGDITACIRFYDKNNVTFDCGGRKVLGDEGYGYGAYMYGGSSNTIKNCGFGSLDIGVSVYSSDSNTVSNCTIENSDISAIRTLYSAGTRILHNRLVNNSEYGIYLYSSPQSVVWNNTAEQNEYGIYCYYSDNNDIRQNTAKNNSWSGIELSQSHYNNVTQNTAIGNDIEGIYLFNSDNNTVSGNTIEGNGWWGLVFAYSQNNTASDNRACLNQYLDVNQINKLENIGTNNTCDKTENWNETSYGCSNQCGISTTTTSTTTTLPECALAGDEPPCGSISLDEVVGAIGDWVSGERTLGEVIALINAWTVTG